MMKEFKEFISRGNVLDMAVGVIMATAFGAIVNSLVNDILMPVLGYLLAGIDFTALAIELGPDAKIMYGNLIQTIISFIFIAFAVFLVVKGVNRARRAVEKKKETAKDASPAAPSDNELLQNILEELKKKNI